MRPRSAAAFAFIAAAGLALAPMSVASAHPGEDHGPHSITVSPLQSEAQAQKILDRELADLTLPKLMVGMDAPKLAISEWVKGDSVQGFESGQTYVVEFWATWCGPCVKAFPHLSELQKKHKDDLTIIGVNIWDRKQNRQTGEYTETMPDLISRVDTFVDGQGEKMGYTVAIEETGKMAQNWMRDAGRNGIPSAFIVDGDGKVAWAGHPASMDKPLEKIIAGDWDANAGRDAQVGEAQGRILYPRIMQLLTDESTVEEGYELVYATLSSAAANDPMFLNAIAWNIATSDKLAARDAAAAVKVATVGCEKTGWSDPSVIDTLARAHFVNGDVNEAIKAQTKAVKLAEGTPMEADLKEVLESYKSSED